ncbi:MULTISPECIES: YjcZ family sporulation protein [Paenibacillus]|nr:MULTISPECIES: YjcZ family sporulation protein [Paenibacillus]USB34534.1 YjcZ family sporulation protein [Paenibacillus sp. YPG26]
MSECHVNRPNPVFTSTGVILVLFILLVIITRTFI